MDVAAPVLITPIEQGTHCFRLILRNSVVLNANA
jgi:hypothetical protein